MILRTPSRSWEWIPFRVLRRWTWSRMMAMSFTLPIQKVIWLTITHIQYVHIDVYVTCKLICCLLFPIQFKLLLLQTLLPLLETQRKNVSGSMKTGFTFSINWWPFFLPVSPHAPHFPALQHVALTELLPGIFNQLVGVSCVSITIPLAYSEYWVLSPRVPIISL